MLVIRARLRTTPGAALQPPERDVTFGVAHVRRVAACFPRAAIYTRSMRAMGLLAVAGALLLSGAASSASAPGRTLTLRGSVRELSADGYDAAMLFGSRKSCRVVGWDARTGHPTTIQRLCVGSNRDSTFDVARAGSQVAWVQTAGGNLLEQNLEVAGESGRKPVSVSFAGSGPDVDGDYFGEVKGAGRYVFFTRFHRCVPAEPDEPPNQCPRRGTIDHGELWVYDPIGRADPCPDAVASIRHCRLLDSEDGRLTLLGAVEPDLAAVRLPSGSAEIFSASAELVRTFPLGAGTVRAALTRSALLVQRGRTIDLYPTSATGKQRTIGVPDARLVDAAGALALLVYGRTLDLVRLKTGGVSKLRVPGRGGVQAQLDTKGLFYSYTVSGKGHVRFIPYTALTRRFRKRLAATSPSKIVYENWSDGDFEIYAIDPGTRALAKLTSNGVEDSSPTPSPDGTKVAFYSAVGTSVVDTDGRNRRLLQGCTGYNLSWSPDSSKIACEGRDGLVVVNADGTDPHQITPSSTTVSAPSWSPDGQTIAYVGLDGIYAVPPTGGTPRLVTPAPADYLLVPTWSPDSRTLVFVTDDPDSLRSDLYAVHADETGLTKLAPNVDSYAPAVSPDGTTIAYTGHAKSRTEVFLVAPDGAGRKQLTRSKPRAGASRPSWSPDGTEIVYARSRGIGGDTDLFAVRSDGTGTRALTRPFPNGGSPDDPTWTRGALVGGGLPPKMHWLDLSGGQQLVERAALAAVFAQGRQAAVVRDDDCADVTVWHPGRPARRTLDPCREGDVLMEMTAAGRQIAWITALTSHTEYDQAIEVAEPGRKASVLTTAQADPEDGTGDYVENLHGDGSLLAFNFTVAGRRGSVRRMWRILPRGAIAARECPFTESATSAGTSLKRCLPLRRGDGLDVLSVGGGRIVGASPNGSLAILRGDGRLVRRFRFGAGLLGARVQSGKLIVLTRRAVSVFAERTGRRLAVWRLPQFDAWPAPQLLDGYRNLVLYRRAAVYLLRITDGKSVVLRAGAQAPPAWAQIGRVGLFYLYNAPYAQRPGRVRFVPLGRLVGALRAG
jgi:Tol biopolymer transport system component